MIAKRIKRATIIIVPAILTFAISSFLLRPSDPASTPPLPEQVRLAARTWENTPKKSWVTVDEQAWNRLKSADPLKKPPKDCAKRFEWAQQHELSPSMPLQHLLTVTAKDRVHVRLVNVYAAQGHRGTPAQRSPAARIQLYCDNASGTQDLNQPMEVAGRTFSSDEKVDPNDLVDSYVFDMGQDAETSLRLAIDSLPGSSPYDYDLIVKLEIDGSMREFAVNEAGRSFRRR